MSDKIIEFNWKLQAVKNIAPNCSFSTDNEGKINWGSGNPLDEPTKAEIDKEIARLKVEYENQTYARSRSSQYPSIIDVVVALAEKEEGNDSMWKEITGKRAKVKADNPKP